MSSAHIGHSEIVEMALGIRLSPEADREKHHEVEAEARDRRGEGSPRPLWLIFIGVALTLFIVLYDWMV